MGEKIIYDATGVANPTHPPRLHRLTPGLQVSATLYSVLYLLSVAHEVITPLAPTGEGELFMLIPGRACPPAPRADNFLGKHRARISPLWLLLLSTQAEGSGTPPTAPEFYACPLTDVFSGKPGTLVNTERHRRNDAPSLARLLPAGASPSVHSSYEAGEDRAAYSALIGGLPRLPLKMARDA